MINAEYISIISKYSTLFFIAFSFYVSIKEYRLFKIISLRIIPYTVLGFIFALMLGAYYSLSGLPLEENSSIIYSNLFKVLRNSFLANAGLILFIKCGISVISDHWEDSYNRIKKVPLKVLVTTVCCNVTLTIIIFKIFDVSSFKMSLWNEIFASMLGVIYEELVNRMFLIGSIIYLLRKYNNKWGIAIVLSTVFWIIPHFDGTSQDIVKLIQLIPFGITLGYMLKKYGFESCIVVHLFFNIFVILIYELI